MVRDYQVIIGYLFVQVFIILASIREATAEESEEEDASSVNISWRSAEFNFLNDFWGHIGRSATEELYFLIIRNLRAEAKVNELDITSVI